MIEQIERAMREAFPEAHKLSSAISYALLSGGKRLRPLIVHYVAEAIGGNFPVMDAALSVEFFHTASLIADDLPCMDNDPLRRGKESVHKVFGTTIALLASYALISEAFKKIEENGRKMALLSSRAFEATTICLEQASRSSGMQGAVLGQYYDLFGTDESIEKIIYLKTGTLFEGAFVLGWVFGGGEFSYLPQLRKMAVHFGMAFQIRDDLLDLSQDEKRGSLNFASLMGREFAKERLHSEVKAALQILDELPIQKSTLHSLLKQVFPE